MEAFALLSRGGAKFDKRKYHEQVNLFKPSVPSPSFQATRIPPELDFFRNGRFLTTNEISVNAKGKQKAVHPPAEDEDDNGTSDTSSMNDAPERRKSNKRRRRIDNQPKAIKSVHRIASTGTRVPNAAGDFASIQNRYRVPQNLMDNLAKYGFAHPTAIQSQAIPILMEKRDMAGISPTGTGKTLAYLLPLFTHLESQPLEPSSGSCALIVCPTRELAGQIFNECLKLAEGQPWNISLFTKGAAPTGEEKQKNADVIIGTPLRIIAGVRDGSLSLKSVMYLVLDEADNLLDPGFVQQTEEIIEACTRPDLQRCIFSATLPPVAEEVAKRVLLDPIRVVVGMKDAASLHVSQSLTYAGSETGKLYALRQLIATNPPLPMLVFVQSKDRAKELYQELLYDNLTVDQLHSDMNAQQRLEAVSRMRRGETWVMVCTEVMARGMDFGGIMGVVNYDFPATVQSYVHRIGRTGRAGRSGTAITYFTDEDLPYLRPIARMIKEVHTQQIAFANAAATLNIDDEARQCIKAPTQPIPDWMLLLRKTQSTRTRKALRTTRPKRASVTEVAGGVIGKKAAIQTRDVIRSSKGHKKKRVPKDKAKGKRKQTSWNGVNAS